MSADNQIYDGIEEGDIKVTSPTSLAIREAIRWSSSATQLSEQALIPPVLKATLSEELPRYQSSRAVPNRAPPLPPPAFPSQAPVQVQGSSRMTTSNVSFAALNNGSESSTNLNTTPHGISLGPNSLVYSSGGSSNSLQSNGTSFAAKRSSTRRSIFRDTVSFLSRERESSPSYPDDSTEIKCEGYLTKRGHVFTNWKTRYFVLRDNILEYFSGEDKSKRYGSVTVAKVAPWSGESHGFMFYTTKQIPYYVYAASEAERAKWLRALKEFYVEPEEVTCEGYLTKRGHLVPSQRIAYYVLNGTSLRHYSDQQSYRENQSAMAEVEIKSVAPWDGETNGIVFKTVTGNMFYVYAENIADHQKWLNCLSGNSFLSVTVNSSSTPVNNTPEPISCAGYLTKQGHKRKSWKKRYFILRGNMMTYYPDYDSANSIRGKALAEVRVEDVQKWDGEPFGFMFMTSEQVPYYVYADNDRERSKWMAALRKLNTVDEEKEIQEEKKRCPNCNAVLTGSRFCGACGFNLRSSAPGTTVGSSRASTIPIQITARSSTAYGRATSDELKDELDDEDTAFDELEALSEGARTLLLAVMQTPEGVDVGDKDGYPLRTGTYKSNANGDTNTVDTFEQDVTSVLEDTQRDETEEKKVRELVTLPLALSSVGTSSPNIPAEPPIQPTEAFGDRRSVPFESDFDYGGSKDVQDSFSSFGGDSEVKQAKQTPLIQPHAAILESNMPLRVLMGGMGPRRTLNSLTMESSSDEEEKSNQTPLPTKPPRAALVPVLQSAQDEEKPTIFSSPTKSEEISTDHDTPGRKSSLDSLELDTRGIAGFDEPAKKSSPNRASIRNSSTDRRGSAKNDLYLHLEKELDFTPAFIPSVESLVRCRLYTSMSYKSAKKVLLFFSDSGPLGLWKQDPNSQSQSLTQGSASINHPFSMLRYLNRAQQDGYGVVLCNPFCNNAVVYEEGGFERVVPIPNSSTPKEHALFVWEQFLLPCRGHINIIAYGRGGILVKNILEVYEASAREKIHRVAFIDSNHEIDGTESPGVLELLGRRSINWEASFEPLGGQIVDSQARVGCVCLSIGYMPPNIFAPEGTSSTLEKAEDASFAFIGANPDRQGMTAIVKFVRAELRRRKSLGVTGNTKRGSRPSSKRQSNVVVLAETDGLDNEANDLSTDVTGEDITDRPAIKEGKAAPYYLPRSAPKPDSGISNGSTTPSRKNQISVDDFDLLKVVGQGGFGKVFLCRKLTHPNKGEAFAMKVLKKQHVLSSGLVNTTMAERRILTEISHPFVVKLHYAFQSETKLYLVMDYLSGGSLAFHLRRRRKFHEDWARFYAAEVAAAIAHLHSVNIIYRDAKLENVLMDHEGHVRITDFGLSKVGVSGLKGATTFCGTAAYIAPELLKGNTYGKAADWWSFGILLYEMIGGKPPYYHRNRDIMFQTILKQEWVTFTPDFSDAAVSLIRGVSSNSSYIYFVVFLTVV
jgi:ribosomal protein S27AE